MAENVSTFNHGWVQIRRDVSVAADGPVARIRQNGDLALSTEFVRNAAIGGFRRVHVFLSADGYRVGLRFHDDEADQNSFQVCPDGGGRNRKVNAAGGRVLQVESIKAQSPAYARLAESGAARDRAIAPKRDASGLWVLELRPCFERVFSGLRGELAEDESGIYRYRWRGETVYIGRGKLRARFAAVDRSEWDFDEIEYSLLNSQEAEQRWESYWIERFREEQGRLPVYNRIAGIKGGRSAIGSN